MPISGKFRKIAHAASGLPGHLVPGGGSVQADLASTSPRSSTTDLPAVERPVYGAHSKNGCADALLLRYREISFRVFVSAQEVK
jgi:hypothetical protein